MFLMIELFHRRFHKQSNRRANDLRWIPVNKNFILVFGFSFKKKSFFRTCSADFLRIGHPNSLSVLVLANVTHWDPKCCASTSSCGTKTGKHSCGPFWKFTAPWELPSFPQHLPALCSNYFIFKLFTNLFYSLFTNVFKLITGKGTSRCERHVVSYQLTPLHGCQSQEMIFDFEIWKYRYT